LERQPELASNYENLAEGDEEPEAVAKLLSVTGPRERAVDAWLRVLHGTKDARGQLRALAQLALLGQTSLVGTSAKSLIEDFIGGAREDADHDLLEDALKLVRIHLGDEECRSLSVRIIASTALDDFEVYTAAECLKSLKCEDEAVQGLWARQRSQRPGPYGAYARLGLIERIGRLGDQEPARAELEKHTLRGGDLNGRIWACRSVAATGSAEHASTLLGRLRGAAKTWKELIALSEAAAELHDFRLARSLAKQAVMASEGQTADFARLADLCARFGLIGLAKRQLDAAKASEVPNMRFLVRALNRLRQPRQAMLLVESYWGDPDTELDECVDIAPEIPEHILGSLLPVLIDRANAEDLHSASRVAEFLFDREFHAEARTLLFSLCARADDSASQDERLWLSQTLSYCGLHASARRQLKHLDEELLDDEQQRWRRDLLGDLLPT